MASRLAAGCRRSRIEGFNQGKPVLDFTAADASMKLLKELGFLGVSSYGGGVSGFDAYHQDSAAMGSAGFTDYAAFVKAIYSQIQRHAVQHDWIPVYYNLADEPIGDELVRVGRECRGVSAGLSEGAALFHRGQQLHRQQSRTTPISGWRRR